MTTPQIVDYFDFDNMKQLETSYCGLYADNTKCHDIEKLNCFFCGCPYFAYDDNGLAQSGDKTVYSKCIIDAIKSSEFISDKAIHQDCTNCDIPHRTAFVGRLADKVIKELT